MIGGHSTGSGWSFFRSSSPSSSSSSSSTHRVTADTDDRDTASSPAMPASITPALSPNNQDLDSLPESQSGNRHDDLDDTQTQATDQAQASSGPDMRIQSLNNESSLILPEPALAMPSPASSSSFYVQAPPDPSESVLTSGTFISDGSQTPVPFHDEEASQPPTPPYHLHSLTERKLEKAVLGRAVGLRQLVLLSNAFATRPAPPPPAPYYSSSQQGYASYNDYTNQGSLQYPHASTSRAVFDDEDFDAGIIEYEEDEAERKRREEDWLDSMLDEMLTDAEDEEEDQDIQIEQQSIAAQKRKSSTRSEREFKEPYVHLSIKHPHPWNIPQIPPYSTAHTPLDMHPPDSLATQHAAMVDEQTSDHAEHVESVYSPPLAAVEHWKGDSGFMEPHAIPLPESTDASPNSSANSQASDDGQEDTMLDREDTTACDEAACDECEAIEDHMDSEETHTDASQVTPAPTYPDIGIPISARYSGTLPSPRSYTSLSLPELAYSATSLNTLSSSPSHSINLFTPGTSPSLTRTPQLSTTPSRAELEKQAWEQQQRHEAEQVDYDDDLEPQEIMLPMDDLDLHDEDERRSSSSRDEDERASSNGSSNGSSTSNEDTTRFKRKTEKIRHQSQSSLELVRYQSAPLQTDEADHEKEDTALRIPLYFPPSKFRHTGLFSVRPAPTITSTSTMPALPPSLLSVMMGKSPVVEVEVPTRSSSTNNNNANASNSEYLHTDKLRLPIFLPFEIVKSLYDSVDFGLPSRYSSSSTAGPSQFATSALPQFEFSNTVRASTSARSAPNSPRSRSKSLTQVDPLFPTSTHASPGGLLFSSLGLCGSRNETTPASLLRGGGVWDQGYSPERRRSHSSSPLESIIQNVDVFGGSAPSSDGGRASRSTRNLSHSHHARTESRSPSRLRLFVDQGETFGDDFEFGTI